MCFRRYKFITNYISYALEFASSVGPNEQVPSDLIKFLIGQSDRMKIFSYIPANYEHFTQDGSARDWLTLAYLTDFTTNPSSTSRASRDFPTNDRIARARQKNAQCKITVRRTIGQNQISKENHNRLYELKKRLDACYRKLDLVINELGEWNVKVEDEAPVENWRISWRTDVTLFNLPPQRHTTNGTDVVTLQLSAFDNFYFNLCKQKNTHFPLLRP